MFATRATEYAIRALLYMSKQPEQTIILKKDICLSQGVTPAFLTKILQPLIKGGIVGSQRGAGGGFFLRKAPEEFTLLEVVLAEEGPLYLNQCLAAKGVCDRDPYCPIHEVWKEIRDKMLGILGEYTFARLASQEQHNLQQLGLSDEPRRCPPPAP